MRKNIIILILTLTLILTGCTINKNSKVKTEIENINTQIDSEVNSNSNDRENKDSTINSRNIISNKKEVATIKSNKNTPNLEVRNKAISEEYIRAIGIVKEFCRNNSLEIKYIQPISDKISSLKDFPNDEHYILLNNLATLGAETIQYFTDEENLNIDLSINTTDASGDNEFRNLILEDKVLDYDKLNDYIKNIYSGEYNSDSVFLNKIDDNKYEVIRIENNNCYYNLVYDPLF
ncbi:hypothetical protein [Clostridium sp. HCS.1]|uniref:hypothetical protein n=1 Tax=Clostridium sp. HCS.1 TaxID=3238594 RepID=UPI003A101941